MKKITYILSLLILASMLNACYDKDGLEKATDVLEGVGKEIEFQVETPLSRTNYLDKTHLEWVQGDRLYIYSPDVNMKADGTDSTITINGTGTTYHEGVYRVTLSHAGDYYNHAEIAAESESDRLFWSPGKCENYWGDASASGTEIGYHRFFAAYPAGRVLTGSDKISLSQRGGTAIFNMEYWTNQRNTFNAGNTENTGTTLLYRGLPDMTNAYMMAMKEIRLNYDHVLLDFDPIMTTLTVKVTAGGYEVPTGYVASTRVTGISVLMDKGLSTGKLSYDLTKGTAYKTLTDEKDGRDEGAGVLKDVGSYTETIYCGVYHEDETQDKRFYIDLAEGESIEFTVFLPPFPQADTKNFKIKVHTTGAYDFVKKLYNTSDPGVSVGAATEGLLQQSHIDIQLPNIKATDDPTKNLWMSHLSDDIKISELSIPGDFLYVRGAESWDTNTQDQITTLLNRGIRAFDIRWLDGSDMLKDILTAINTFLNENPTEGIIIFDNRAITSGTFLNHRGILSGKFYDFDKSELKNNVTLGNLRGRVIHITNRYDTWRWSTSGTNYGNCSSYVDVGSYTHNQDPRHPLSLEYNSKIRFSILPYEYDGVTNYWTNYWNFYYTDHLLTDTDKKDVQSGKSTGVVMISYSDKDWSGGAQLTQALIDCNYKFHYK